MDSRTLIATIVEVADLAKEIGYVEACRDMGALGGRWPIDTIEERLDRMYAEQDELGDVILSIIDDDSEPVDE